jgi:hypothetical protein
VPPPVAGRALQHLVRLHLCLSLSGSTEVDRPRR